MQYIDLTSFKGTETLTFQYFIFVTVDTFESVIDLLIKGFSFLIELWLENMQTEIIIYDPPLKFELFSHAKSIDRFYFRT